MTEFDRLLCMLGKHCCLPSYLSDYLTEPFTPKSLSTMYKIYGSFIEMERAKINGAVGKKVIDQALDGDFKSQELFLRSKGGWSPTQTNIEVEQETDPELDESATDTLMSLLGYNTDATEEETTCSCEEDNCRCS